MIERDELERRRAAARRPAGALGVGVFLVYLLFILTGVVGQ